MLGDKKITFNFHKPLWELDIDKYIEQKIEKMKKDNKFYSQLDISVSKFIGGNQTMQTPSSQWKTYIMCRVTD